MNLKEIYGSLKINRARVKYGPENFSDEVLAVTHASAPDRPVDGIITDRPDLWR